MTEDLVDKRKVLLEESEEHKAKRNELNAQASQFARERNELNNATRQYVEDAQKNKELRDQSNTEVQSLKEKRNELNDKANALFEQIDALRGEQGSGAAAQQSHEKKPTSKDIQRQIDQLEVKQQTETMSKEKENELVDKIKQLRSELKDQVVEHEQNKEVRGLLIDAREFRKQASAIHAEVTEKAELAQKHHDLMVECYRKADKSREGADAKHKQFVEAQEAADAEHKSFLECQKQLRDYDKVLTGIHSKQRKVKNVKENKSARKEAENIFNAFKSGERLTTEDLLKLQRSKLI